MIYTIYTIASGRIDQIVSCDLDQLAGQYDAQTQAVISGVIDDARHYISGGLPVAIPAQPSPHHHWDWGVKQWIDPRTLADFRSAKWTEIKYARAAAEFGGFVWDARVFDSDAMSQSRIIGAAQLARINPAFTITWTLADNSVRQLSATDMVAVGVALGDHVATQHAKARTLRAQIEAAQTVAQVAAVGW